MLSAAGKRAGVRARQTNQETKEIKAKRTNKYAHKYINLNYFRGPGLAFIYAFYFIMPETAARSQGTKDPRIPPFDYGETDWHTFFCKRCKEYLKVRRYLFTKEICRAK